MKSTIYVLQTVVVIALTTFQPEIWAQEKIKVMSDGPLQPGLVQVAEAFRRESGSPIEFVFGTSPVIHKKVVEGETADALIIQPNFLGELAKSGKVVAGDYPVIGRVGFGLAARVGTSLRDIATTEAFKQALLNADALIFNNVASGNYFAKVLERLGIAEAVKAKVVRADPAAVFERVIQGKGNDIGVGTLPSINATKDLRLIGPFPAELQNYIVYAAALMTGATSPRTARAFIVFLSSPAAKALLAANGVE